MRTHTILTVCVLVTLLAVLPPAAIAGVRIGTYSKQNGTGRATVGGSVSHNDAAPPSSGPAGGSPSGPYAAAPSYPSSPTAASPGPTSGGTVSEGGVSGGETVTFDPRFRGGVRRAPFDAPGTACLYFPNAPGACPRTPAPAPPNNAPRGRGRPRAPPIDPFAVAGSIARSIPLLPGRIYANPSVDRSGWTGVASWFWLDPAPRTIAAVATLGAERVVVTAAPSPEWQFGDGAVASGGPGRPYRRGESMQGAIHHAYSTRCLPGDRGRNPYVLDSCTDAGYLVAADVTWAITFVATGPAPAAGTLPSRITSTSVAYPVSEVRAFLSGSAA